MKYMGIRKNITFMLSDGEKQDIMERLAGYLESRKEISFAYIYGSTVSFTISYNTA